MVRTRIQHRPTSKWDSTELSQLKEKLANLNCKCPVCERTNKDKVIKIHNNSDLSVQTENLYSKEDACQCTESLNRLDLAQSSEASYDQDIVYDGITMLPNVMHQPPYPPYIPCPSCMMMSSMLLSRATNFKDEEIEVNIRAKMKDKCDGASIVTKDQGTVVSVRPSLATECDFLTTVESDTASDESDANKSCRGVNMVTFDFKTGSKTKVNDRSKKKRGSHINNNKWNRHSDVERKCKTSNIGAKKKRCSALKITKSSSDGSDLQSRSNCTDDDLLITNKRVRISQRKDRNSGGSKCDLKYNSMDEENVKGLCITDRVIFKVENDECLTKKPVPDTKCANLETFLKQIRQPLPTFSELDLTSSYSDVTFSELSTE